jgi:nitrogen-specific signal transduction histidine kinase
MLSQIDILASLSNPVAVITAVGAVEYANRAFSDLFASVGGEASSVSGSVAVPPVLSGRLQKVCGRIQNVGMRAHLRWTPEDHADDTFAVHVTRASEDRFVVVLEPISEMVQIEEIHSRTRSYLEGVLNSLNLGVIGLDPRFNITFINRDQAALFARAGGDCSPFELIGARVATVYPLLTADQWEDAFERVVQAREVVTCARVGLPRDKPESHFALKIVPLVDAQSRVTGGVCVTEEITRLVRLEQDLIEHERLALAGQIVIALNHEINNPLTVILWQAQLAQRSTDEATVRAMATIETQALRIADVTRRLREQERIHLTPYLKNGPLMIDLRPGAGAAA